MEKKDGKTLDEWKRQSGENSGEIDELFLPV